MRFCAGFDQSGPIGHEIGRVECGALCCFGAEFEFGARPVGVGVAGLPVPSEKDEVGSIADLLGGHIRVGRSGASD